MDRKNKCFDNKLDSLFWWIVMLLPVIVYIAYYMWTSTVSMLGFGEFLKQSIGLNFLTDSNIIYSVFNTLFGEGSQYFPIFTESSGMTVYFTYAVTVIIVHVLFDVVAFIPRFAHNLLDKFY